MSKELNLLEQTLRRLNNGPKFNKKSAQRRNKKMRGGNIQNPPNRKTSKPKRSRRRKAKGSSGSLPSFPSGLGRYGGLKHKPTIITDDENLGVITSAGNNGFNMLAQYPINPGQATTFPWLSSIAKNYEKFKFLSLTFYIVPQVSAFATAGQTGEMVMSVDYDASDAAPGSYQQMTDTWPHSSAPPPVKQSIQCNPREMHKESDAKFVRPGGVIGGTDIKTYDCGNLFIGSTGLSGGAVTMCSLHVKYTCEFSVPILENFAQAPQNNSVSMFTSGGTGETSATNVMVQSNLGTVVTNGLAIVNTAGSLVPPPGNYLVDVNWQCICSATDLDEYIGDIRKNGTSLFKTNLIPNTGLYSGVLGDLFYHLSASEFISCNGTDALTFFFEAAYTGGTFNNDVRVRFTAI
jgi:hypothetical protein